jgi:hypothetical protein
MNVLEARYPNATAKEWKKVRNYLYKQKRRTDDDDGDQKEQQRQLLLLPSQVESVVDFLDSASLPTSMIIQQSPRILRSNVATKLRPTYEFLHSLLGGDDTCRRAIERNPDLLLTSQIGYQTPDNLGLIEFCLQTDLQWSDQSVATLRRRHPMLFQQSVSRFLTLLQHLRRHHGLSNEHISKLLLKQPTLFQLSIEALEERVAAVDFLTRTTTTGEQRRVVFAPANVGILCQSAESIRQKVTIVGSVAASKHPPILGLSLDNIRSKLDFFATLHPNLASAILTKSPSVMSLKLESIQAKVQFLQQELWRNSTIETGLQLSQAPTCLSISLESNLRPTVAFFRTTQYWNHNSSNNDDDGDAAPVTTITGRHLAASLYGRLLPRYLFRPNATLSQLVFDSDAAFGGGRYLEFRNSDVAKQAVDQARWQLWLETGVLPIQKKEG